MDGKTATTLIREIPEYKNIPIIAVTAHVIAEDEKLKLEQIPGFTKMLTKPVSYAQLRETIDQTLKKNDKVL